MNKPFLSASVFQNKIQIIFFDILQGCYRCIFPEPPPPFLMNNCSDAGVLGATTGIAGSMAATLAIKFFINRKNMPVLKITTFDNNNFKTEQFSFLQKSNCPSCLHKRTSWPTKGFNLAYCDINFANYTVIDLREHTEKRHDKLTTTEHHIPFSVLIDKNFDSPSGDLLLYCHSGLRSEYAAYLLQKKGLNAFSLEGGLTSLNAPT